MVIYLMCLFKSFDSKILKFCLLHTEFYLFYKFEDFFFKSLNIRSIQNKPDHLIETYFSEETHSLGRFFNIISFLICIFLRLVQLMYLIKSVQWHPLIVSSIWKVWDLISNLAKSRPSLKIKFMNEIENVLLLCR